MIHFHNIDCMEFMHGQIDKAFDLAIVDPPYGIKQAGDQNFSREKLAKSKNYKPFYGNDLSSPDSFYFQELFRVSKNQIIWGANHFISKIPIDSSCWIVWDKQNGETDFADCEMAWTNFKTAVRKFTFRWQGMLQGNMKAKEIRIHPTQKPVALYRWLFEHYWKPGWKVIDTHGGSMSIAIAAHDIRADLDICKIDKDYFSAGKNRVEEYQRQGQFDFTGCK